MIMIMIKNQSYAFIIEFYCLELRFLRIDELGIYYELNW
jgi:hypothetical protein